MNIRVYELRLKIYTLADILLDDMLAVETQYIDSALALDEKWLKYHKSSEYKSYSFGGLYPLDSSGLYKKDNVYTITIRTVDCELAAYFSRVLVNHHTNKLKGLTIESRIIPKKFIQEIYTLTPVIQKNDNGYWRNNYTLEQYEKRLFENAINKYNAFTGSKINEDFQLYTQIQFLNKKPVKFSYKGITLLGDKINLKIADNKNAQDLAYFLTGTGLCENCSRGAGYCNYKWL